MGARVAYLIGAGASYGERGPKGVNYVKRGIPVVNEMVEGIDYVIANLFTNPFSNDKKTIISHMRELKQHCAEYPTIDTYAKMLYTTKRFKEYEKLKRQLSVYFLLMQEPNRRDIRYDGFIASLIDEKTGKLPNINVLSWNYDAQFEFAIADYVPKHDKLASITAFLNERNKVFKMNPFISDDRFALVKLNGTAFFEQTKSGTTLQFGNYRGDYWDTLPDNSKFEIFEDFLAHAEYENGPYECGLSYAWEHYPTLEEDFYDDLRKQLADTEALVVIGYSFPYVNRKVDKMLFEYMPKLRKVYIQDTHFFDVEERVMTIRDAVYTNPFPDENIHGTDNCSQFLIPNELV